MIIAVISMRTFMVPGDNCFRKLDVLTVGGNEASLESDHTISTTGNDQVCSVLVALSVTARCCFVAHQFLRHVLLVLSKGGAHFCFKIVYFV
ncbi:unnamed protein product [Wuchereria bancrofti]|uniref:Uncharacterized protein n=1 Tax=Wuchereria bancrofti TaxID=6293 RepID=A0A3P7FM65_WUCBA|nr:unnamed protein product [Wuchereria bancrofti]